MPRLEWRGKYDADGARHRPPMPQVRLRTTECGGSCAELGPNRLIAGPTEQVLPALLSEFAGQVKLAYIDPPFATGLDFTSTVSLPGGNQTNQTITRAAYRDTWDDLDDYLRWMDETLALLHMLLAEDGALLLHCDWRAEGMLRLLLDEVFGPENFRNAIIWSYRSGGASRRESLARKHDTLLLYAKSPRFQIRPQVERQYLRKPFMGSRRDAQGRHYVDTLLRDVLEGEITCVGAEESLLHYNVRPVLNLSRERLDYPTQKPLGLLRLLIALASDPGDLVLDCCCGSGATPLAAESLGRRWIAADASPLALQTTRKRLLALTTPRPFVVQQPVLEAALAGSDGSPEGSLAGMPNRASLAVAIEQFGDAVTMRLTGYTPPPGSPLSIALSDDEDPANDLRFLDSWSVDWAYNGEVFRHGAHVARMRNGTRELATALTHTYEAPGVRAIAIHAVDLAAHEMLVVLRAEVEDTGIGG